ncbi:MULTISPECIES: hypothetical protein [Pasteurellaceae]|uniref:hypothetical protein n=1 Tax=Pasteurellaceae TaxID=712 RepID=UPI003562CCDD
MGDDNRDHTKAYYRDEDVINFLAESNEAAQKTINLQRKTWNNQEIKTKTILFNKGIVDIGDKK